MRYNWFSSIVFFFIFCSFGANNNHIILHASIILHVHTILHAYIILHAHTPSSRRRHLPYTHHQRHSPSNEHRVVTLPAGRMETRRGFPPKRPREPLPWLSIGEISLQNARVDHSNKCSSSSACFSEARKGKGEGSVSSPDWRRADRTRQERAERGVRGKAGPGTGRVSRRRERGAVQRGRAQS